MTVDWAAHRVPVIEAIRDGAYHIDDVTGDPVIGPQAFDAIDYPHAEILPQSSDRTGGHEFTHQVRFNYYFQLARDRRGEHVGQQYLDHLDTVMTATSEIMEQLKDEAVVVNYAPGLVEDYAGTQDGSLVVLISVRFDVITLVDMAET